MMIKLCHGLLGLALVSGPAIAMDAIGIRNVILDAYPGARIAVVETQIYDGEKIFGVQFQHGGEKFVARLSLDGDFIKVGTED
ncbi:MAG: hypothetical protein GY783_08700 [Gammaproteobacteria bacterium]|nr:hypothetical protein [Gammaproteobacteria bacterium]